MKHEATSGHLSTMCTDERIPAVCHLLIDSHSIFLSLTPGHLHIGKDTVHIIVQQN
jgi:hypothetical protein